MFNGCLLCPRPRVSLQKYRNDKNSTVLALTRPAVWWNESRRITQKRFWSWPAPLTWHGWEQQAVRNAGCTSLRRGQSLPSSVQHVCLRGGEGKAVSIVLGCELPWPPPLYALGEGTLGHCDSHR